MDAEARATGEVRTARLAAYVTLFRTKIVNLSGWKRSLAAFAAGASAALALAPFYALPLMLIGFSTLLLLLEGAASTPRPRRAAFALGWQFGFGYFLIGLYWMAFPFFVDADQFAWMAPFAVAGMPAFLAIFYGAAAAATAAFRRDGWRRAALFAAFFMCAEYARGHILTGLPWNLPGQALAGSALLAQSASIYGVYGLSLVVVVAAVAPAALPGARGLARGGAVSVLIFALLVGFGALRMANGGYGFDRSVLIRIVQPNIPQQRKNQAAQWEYNFFAHLKLSTAPTPAGARLVVLWPEDSVPWLGEQPGALATLAAYLPPRATLIAGTVLGEKNDAGGGAVYNGVRVFTFAGGRATPTARYLKHHLVPFGEYLPLAGLLRALGLAQLAPYADGFAAGPGPAVIDIAGRKVAPLICYETIFPGAVYPKKSARPDWIAAVTDDAWFGNSSGPLQHLDQGRLRAIETGLPMARAANTGVSAMIDAQGRYIRRLKLYAAGVIDAALPLPAPTTLYARLGDFLFWLMTVMLLAAPFRTLNAVATRRG